MSVQKDTYIQPEESLPRPQRRRKKRRIRKLRIAVLLFIVVLIIAAVTVCAMLLHSPGGSEKADKQNAAMFGVKSILVEGNTHYTNAQIIEASGIYEGQSLFFVNKRRAAEQILNKFPYVEKVSVNNPSFSQIKIMIDEAKPMGVIEQSGGWLVVGENGKGLELLPADSSRLQDCRVIKSEILKSGGVGHLTLDERRIDILNILDASFKNSNLSDVKGFDFTDCTSISLNWKNAITIKIGSDIDLEPKLKYASKTLTRVLSTHGETAKGQIDITSYSEENPSAVYTPEDLLTTLIDHTETTGQSATTTSAA